MTPVFSGGLIYEYTQEPSNYGIVEIKADGSIQLLSDFDSLQAQFNTLNNTALQSVKSENRTVTPPVCRSSLITTEKFSNNFTIPAQPSGVTDLITNGISNAPVGKLVPVTTTTVSQEVKDTKGNVISGLAIRVLADDETNTPSGASPSGTPSGTTNTTPASPTASKSAAVQFKAGTALMAGGLLAAWSLLA